VPSTGETFIIDGQRLKAVNQWFNKRNARLQSIKDKQGIKGTTNQQKDLYRRRNNQVNDYVLKTARTIINYCLLHDIGMLVIGYHETLQRRSNLGKRNNQQKDDMLEKTPYYKKYVVSLGGGRNHPHGWSESEKQWTFYKDTLKDKTGWENADKSFV